MEDLNLHFTGDIHAIGAANNLLAALLDASILHGNPHKIDALRIGWRRALDMNDRALRKVALGLGGRANGYPRESGFDITAASEVMAILAVARDLQDLRRAAGRHHRGPLLRRRQAGDRRGPGRGRRHDRAAEGRAQAQPDPDPRGPGLPDARGPLRQHRPRQLLPGGRPDRAEAGDYVVTESGFGSDMGMEKFFDIVCRNGGVRPSAVVLVATVRALKHHGGIEDDPAGGPGRGLDGHGQRAAPT